MIINMLIKITFTLLEDDSTFRTLVGNEINLTKDPVFLGEKVANLAGVMGGEDSACSSDTRSVIVECAYFNPRNHWAGFKIYIQSEATYKFEKVLIKIFKICFEKIS